MSLQRDGTLALDTDQAERCRDRRPGRGDRALRRQSSTSSGVMGSLSSAIKAYNQTGTGLLTQHQTDLQNRVKTMTNSVNREQDRLDRYQALLQKQFTAMDTTVTANNSDMSYLSQTL